ncbi:MAG: Fic family protein [Planctomycetes bacterium]|nr:Fic family protein [Planctomycetota bacterium]
MMTLRQFARRPRDIPAAAAWYLADLGEARGKQELCTKQSPQKLRVLREHALVESAVSSNRIEGVEVAQDRIRTLVFGKPLLRDRAEEEVRGYRDALKLVHEEGSGLPLNVDTLLGLHRLVRGEIGDAGRFRDKGCDIIETLPGGGQRVRFRAVEAPEVPTAVRELLEGWQSCLDERWVHPLAALAAFNLDFLCIHPFRDGNGRVSRLLLLLQCYHLGFEVGRYISLERLIEENKDRYYETLELSSQRWHQGKHDPWPYIGHLLYILKTAYREFEGRLGQVKAPRGAKTELVMAAIEGSTGPFSVGDIQRQCPGVSIDLIRRVLKQLRSAGRVRCLRLGANAEWERTDARK